MFDATLSSDERLKSRTQINFLFDEGQQLFSHPLKVFYHIHEESIPNQGLHLKFGVTVPKSLYKKAVSRNRLKRKIRESYRIHKAAFLAENQEINKSIDWFFIYIDRKANEEKIEAAMVKLFSDLKKLIYN